MASIQASAENRGTFGQGTIGTVIFRVNDIDGTPLDAETITYEIKHADSGEVVMEHEDSSPEKVKTGIYVFDWNVPSDQEIGRYTVTWKYMIQDEDFEYIQSIVVAKDGTDSSLYSGRLLLFRQALELYIEAAQAVPVYNQFARPSRDNQKYYFTKGNWNQARGTTIILNKEIVTDGYKIDFAKGCVIFDKPLTKMDTVQATYNFRWFNDEQLDRFLQSSVHVINSFAPVTYYFIGNMPDRHITAVLYGAAVDAIRTLMFNLNWSEPAQYFGSRDRAKEVISSLEGLKKNFEETWKMLLEQKKNFPYRGLTKSIVTPEYTLPGGRSRMFRYMFTGSFGAG